ncbi:MAG: hypothetical protein RQ842_09445 [Vulcanisaeta sp.]|nr:hypothetical protein [Vulcanisaeta sp.]
MSGEDEKKIVDEKTIAREIFGEDERRRTWDGDRWVDYGIPSWYPTTAETSSRRRVRVSLGERGRAYALLGAFMLFFSLGIVSGWWLFYAPVNYLATHLLIVNIAVNFIILSDVALWVFMLLPFLIMDPDDDLGWIAPLVSILSIIFATIGVFVAMGVYGIPSALWVGMNHPFSLGGMNVTSIYSFVTLPTNASLPLGSNATNGLYIATLGISVNGLPLNATLVITNATFFNPFTHLTCVPYSSNIGKLSFPIVVDIKATKAPFLYLFYLPSINISKIKLSFLCNGIPTKAVLVTNYGNFTYLLVS